LRKDIIKTMHATDDGVTDRSVLFAVYTDNSSVDNDESYNIAYKDVHKRIRRLDSLGLIEKVPIDQIHTKRESIHAPIFYRLTLGGLFNLLYKNRTLILYADKEKIFHYHGKSIIFETFIYPFFEKSTLVGIKGSFLPEIIFSYLSECCEITDDTIEGLAKGSGFKALTIPLLNWNEVPGEHDETTVKTIADEFEIDFSEDSKIEKIDNRTVRISDKKHSVTIRVNYKKKAARLISDDGRTYGLTTERSGNDFILKKVGKFREDIALPVMRYNILYNLLNLAFSILMGVRIGGSENDFLTSRPVLDTDDFRILSRDPKVIDLIEETDKAYRIRYNIFVESNKTNRSS
jgi:hypothetical protein